MSTSAVIREIRKENQMQIGQLAELSGLHRNTVYRVERGDDISVANFEKKKNPPATLENGGLVL